MPAPPEFLSSFPLHVLRVGYENTKQMEKVQLKVRKIQNASWRPMCPVIAPLLGVMRLLLFEKCVYSGLFLLTDLITVIYNLGVLVLLLLLTTYPNSRQANP